MHLLNQFRAKSKEWVSSVPTIDRRSTQNLDWLTRLKGIGILWIMMIHGADRMFSPPRFSNPNKEWGTLGDRLQQLIPFGGYGWGDLPINVIRYVSWLGDQGVQLFLIASGFGLTWSLLQRGDRQPAHPAIDSQTVQALYAAPSRDQWLTFYGRRFGKLFPMWWAVHLLYLVPSLLLKQGMALDQPTFYLSFFGWRMTPDTFYYFSPSWWFMGLIIQLYVMFPVLYLGLKRWGALKFLLGSAAIAILIRGIGLTLLPDPYLDLWNRGNVWITRLPEFVLGMSLALGLYQSPQQMAQLFRSRRFLAFGAVLYGLGLIGAFTLWGMSASPFLLGAGLLILLYPLLNQSKWNGIDRLGLRWLGEHSYALFLVHHPIVIRAVREQDISWRSGLGFILAIAVSIGVTIGLEKGVKWIMGLKFNQIKSGLKSRRARGLFLGGGIAIGGLLGTELAIRKWMPQETEVWGEVPSLMPDDQFGWKLKPNQTTQLRWEDYDYPMIANSLGFPGPDYPEAKAANTFRILVTGDAFSSGDGVQPQENWVRLLEQQLAQKFPDRKIEVLNFAITGYGPEQYARVVKAFAPKYKPDLILVEHYVNDYDDVMYTPEEFRDSIGFNKPDPNSLGKILKLSHLSMFVRKKVYSPLKDQLKGKPYPLYGYYLADFDRLKSATPESIDRMTRHFREIQQVAQSIGAPVWVPMVPSAAQVCTPEQLPYYPKNLNLSEFDFELPQRNSRAIAQQLKLNLIDLIPALKSAPNCPYQPYNKHWLPIGHAAIANYLTDKIQEIPNLKAQSKN